MTLVYYWLVVLYAFFSDGKVLHVFNKITQTILSNEQYKEHKAQINDPTMQCFIQVTNANELETNKD